MYTPENVAKRKKKKEEEAAAAEAERIRLEEEAAAEKKRLEEEAAAAEAERIRIEEEAAAAAESLQSQAQQLVTRVSTFVLDESSVPSTSQVQAPAAKTLSPATTIEKAKPVASKPVKSTAPEDDEWESF